MCEVYLPPIVIVVLFNEVRGFVRMENIVDFLKLEKPVVFWGVFALYAKTRNPRVETLTVTTRQLKCQQKCWVECLTVIRISTVIIV